MYVNSLKERMLESGIVRQRYIDNTRELYNYLGIHTISSVLNTYNQSQFRLIVL